MSTDKMREEFEAFHRQYMEKQGFDQRDIESDFDRDDNGDYIYCTAADGWAYWQASRTALVVELPTVDGASLTATACRIITKKCRAAIIAAGVRVKP